MDNFIKVTLKLVAFCIFLVIDELRIVSCNVESMEPGKCLSKFDYDYKILRQLILLETKLQAVEAGQRSMEQTVNDQKEKTDLLAKYVAALNETLYHYTDDKELSTLCPDGWLAYKGSCYLFGYNNEPFATAEEFCRLRGSYLVRAESEDENNFLRQYMTNYLNENRDYWIGMTDAVTERTWTWYGTETQVQFLDWARTEPQDAGNGEDCAVFGHFLKFSWADVPCTTQRAALCEKNMSGTTLKNA